MKKELLDFLLNRIKEEASTAEEYAQEINDEAKCDEHLAKMGAFQEVAQYIENNL
jgi:hypothetical protein